MKQLFYLKLTRWLCLVVFLLMLIIYKILESNVSVLIAGILSILLCYTILVFLFRINEKGITELSLLEEKYEQLSNLLKKSTDELEKRNSFITQKMNELSTLGNISKAMTSTMELDEILNIILE